MVTRYSRITLEGTCLEPELSHGEQVDGLVDFEFEDIEIGDFVLYIYGNTEKRIKKVLALAGDYFQLNEKEIITTNKTQGLTDLSIRRISQYGNQVPKDCIIATSCENKCDYARVVHRESITRLIKRPRGGFIINSSQIKIIVVYPL